MSSSSPIERMRSAIAMQLQNFGVKQPLDLHETLLIRNGLFCGRKFQCDGINLASVGRGGHSNISPAGTKPLTVSGNPIGHF